MRKPGRWRNVGLVVLASGVAAAAAVGLLPATGDGVRAALACWAAVAVLFGGGTAWARHRDLQAQAALARGEDVLGRWHVDAGAWRAFVALERAASGPPFNELSVRDAVPAEGVDVVVGSTAIVVDGSVHRIPLRGTPEVTDARLHEGPGRPAVVELQLYYPGGGRGASGVPLRAVRTCLRFPVAPGALAAARDVVARYARGRGAEPDFFHGRGDGSDPEDLSRCWSCGYETHAFRSHCPECGSSLQSRRWARRFGVGLALGGLFITGVMGAVLAFTAPLLLQPGRAIGGTTFNGTPTQAAVILLLFGVVLAFGVTTLCYGLGQMATGRRSRAVAMAMLGVFVLLVVLARWL